METLRDIKRKISAVKKTQQITKAMNMVAAAKLRSAQEAMERFKPYARKFAEVLGDLAERVEPDIHPLLVAREDIKALSLVVVASDRGLCGSYNANILNTAEKWCKQQSSEGKEVTLTLVGRKARDYFRRRNHKIGRELIDYMGKYDFAVARNLAQGIIGLFLENESQQVFLLHSEFISVGYQKPSMRQLLPLTSMHLKVTGKEPVENVPVPTKIEYLYEPAVEDLMIRLLPKNIEVQVYGALLEAVVSEQAARMTAMDNAQSNCNEMVDTLTLAYNKARQASITTELMDIVCGAEALK